MKYAYRLGKSLMLPVACLPVAGLLMGIGFWMDPVGHGDSYLISQILVKAGSILIDHMSLLFTLGVAVGMADEQDGTAALAGVAHYNCAGTRAERIASAPASFKVAFIDELYRVSPDDIANNPFELEEI